MIPGIRTTGSALATVKLMTGDDPEPTNPLSPYYPSEVPDIPTPGRRWVAILLFLSTMAGILLWLFLRAFTLL